MSKIKNSDLITKIFEALFTVIGRRTLDSFALKILKTTLEKLETKFDFLGFITIHDDFFSEEGIQATIDHAVDSIEPSLLGNALDALIRVVYLELTETIGDDVGFYFITEVKEHLGDVYVDELQKYGIHLEKIQDEQHMRCQMKGTRPVSEPFLYNNEQNTLPYTWDTVSTWRYDNNVCFLYDTHGRVLDTLQLDLIIEDYVERVTEAQRHHLVSVPKTSILKITEKENQLLKLMKQRDIDKEYAVTVLHMSHQKFDAMIQKLLQLEMLQYISENEVKLTEKGLDYLSSHKMK
ncbi:MAG: hypothetical protein BV458_01505 [Thermoplasmata archaeon M9B2D]|nr:MAG: hypothetical protein BV458_01505 [Thermoplasmata archaeon M9B2D]